MPQEDRSGPLINDVDENCRRSCHKLLFCGRIGFISDENIFAERRQGV